jgi:hypothetical protein
MDIDDKLNNYLKITDIMDNVFGQQKTLHETRMQLHSTLTLAAVLHSSGNWTIKARDARSMRSRDEIHEKNRRIHLDRTQNKHRDCKGNKYKPSFEKSTGIQEKIRYSM